MKIRIFLGTVGVAVVGALLAFVAVGEQDRMAAFTVSYQARQIEAGADLFEDNCRTCHGPQGQGLVGVAPAINAADLFNGQRLQAMAFAGSVQDYLRGVIAAGRPVPSAGTTYPQRMPTWSQRYGGPLRDDQVDSLVSFIMNWEEQALAGAQVLPTLATGQTVGSDIAVALPAGDAQAGADLAESLGCSGCHLLSAVGPAWLASGDQPGMGARAETRLDQPNYIGQATSPEQYLVESILLPDAYVVQGFDAGVMPGTYGGRITARDLADLVAYLMSLR